MNPSKTVRVGDSRCRKKRKAGQPLRKFDMFCYGSATESTEPMGRMIAGMGIFNIICPNCLS